MLNVQQIEALRLSNPQLYEALKRLANATLGPNQGWSLDDQVTDGANFARVASNALTSNQIDPTKPGVLMRGSVPPTWSGAFTYVSTTSSLTWSWSGLSIFRADGTTTAIPNGSVAVTGLTAGTTYYFYPYWDDVANALAWVAGSSGAGTPAYAQTAKTNLAAQQQALQGRIPLSQGAIAAATTTSGTGGGSGGGSGSCLRAGAMVLTKERGTVPVESCKVGEHLRCPSTGAITSHRRRDYHLDAAPSPSGAPSLAVSAKGGFDPVGARYIVPGADSCRDAAHPPISSASSADVECGSLLPPSSPKLASADSAAKKQRSRSSPPEAENPNEGWTRIVRLEVRDCDTFIRLHFSNAESLDVTPHHIFTLADGSPMRAERLCLSDILVGRFGRLTLRKIEAISPNVAQVFRPEASRAAAPSEVVPSLAAAPTPPGAPLFAPSAKGGSDVGAQHAPPGADSWRDAAHPPRIPALSSRVRPDARFSQTADEACLRDRQGSAVDVSVEAGAFRPPKSDEENEGLQPRPSEFAPAVSPWQKVTISCEPSHQFFAGCHSASILTHNYTFSS